jgi:hypothetical protein
MGGSRGGAAASQPPDSWGAGPWSAWPWPKTRGRVAASAALWHAWDFGDAAQAPDLYRAARQDFLAAGQVMEAGEVGANEAASLYFLGHSGALAAADEAERLVMRPSVHLRWLTLCPSQPRPCTAGGRRLSPAVTLGVPDRCDWRHYVRSDWTTGELWAPVARRA